MTYAELQTVLRVALPAGFQIETDNDGQLIVYTGLQEVEDEDELAEYDGGPKPKAGYEYINDTLRGAGYLGSRYT